jgi:hypothetical protein
MMVVIGITLIIGGIATLAFVWDAGLAVPAVIIGFLFLMAGICVRAPARRGAGRGGGDYTEPAERRGNVLEYEIRRPQTPNPPPLAAQVVVGFVTWVAAVAAAVAMLQSAPFRIAGSGGVAFGIFALLSLVIALAVWVRLRFEWRGFIPGLLIGFGITCLLPVGIVAVICGHP